MRSFLFVNLLGTSSTGYKAQHPAVENHINFRVGVSSGTSNGQPTLCLEGPLPKRWSFETCGTGYGFVHQIPGIDLLHVRGKFNAINRSFGSSQVRGFVGAGFAEVQTAGDQLGFQFSDARNGVETSGPEISGSIQWWLELNERSELILDTNVGAAYFAYGPKLTLPQPKLFPFVEFSIGFGW